MKKIPLWKNIIIGKIYNNHPPSEKIDEAVDEINNTVVEISKEVEETLISFGKMSLYSFADLSVITSVLPINLNCFIFCLKYSKKEGS